MTSLISRYLEPTNGLAKNEKPRQKSPEPGPAGFPPADAEIGSEQEAAPQESNHDLAVTADETELRAKVSRLLKSKRIKLGEIPPGVKAPERVQSSSDQFLRSPAIRAWILLRANGKCEACKNPAPFRDEHGFQYLEVHHVRTLAEGGSDRVENTVALCPNCHRRAHFGQDKQQLVEDLYKKIPRLHRE